MWVYYLMAPTRSEMREQRLDQLRLDISPRQAGRQHPQVVLPMTAQQRIDLVFQVAYGQWVRRNHIRLRERSFHFFDFRLLGRRKIALSQLQTRVPDFL